MVLITGSAGLLGNELLNQLLAKGISVRAIYNKRKPLSAHPLLETIKCSITDVIGLDEAMEGIDHVYHCAGLVSFSGKNIDELYKINVEGTANIVNASLEHGVKKLVHVSSVAALSRSNTSNPINEHIQWTGKKHSSNYGKSKYLGEMEVWRGISEGLEAVIVNPSIILGPGNWDEGSTSIFKSVYNGTPWYTEGIKGFVDVRDVAAAMILLMNSNISGERFILSSKNESFKELFSNIAICFNKAPASRKATPFMASVVWRWQALKGWITGTTPMITKETSTTAFARDLYDNSKLLKFFPGFSYTPLDITITDTCSSLQQKLNNP